MTVLIAMSGGVDSSVAAYLMNEKGYECIGCTMKLYANEDVGLDMESTCCSLDDIADAREVANSMDMPYYVLNFKENFRERVIDYFTDSYEHGRTPNPCIECNRHLKFDQLYKRAREYGCDKIVTGHYARVDQVPEGYVLRKAVDETKDQSYVLYSLTQEQLAHTLFPLGEYSKSEIRTIAAEHGFINADKPDSQDICFVPDGDYVAAIKRFTGKEYPEGDFVDAEGRVLGRHKGIIGYTIGQRKGLGISSDQPYFVTKLDVDKNQVVLGRSEDLFSKRVLVREVNWITPGLVQNRMEIKAKLRYRQKEQPARLTILDDNSVELDFEEAQRAATPGQAAVFYLGDIVLGGGIIVASMKETL